jgi:hypothetical protein
MLGVFYYFARRLGPVLCAWAFTWMLAAVPVLGLTAFELAGYADTTLCLYLLAAGGFLAMWINEGCTAGLIGASLAATAAAWTKNEGQFFLLAVLAVFAVSLLRARAPVWQWLIAAGPSIAVLAAWSLVRQAHGVEAAGFSLGLSFDPELLRIALRSLLSRAAQPGSFHLVFYLWVAALAGAWRLRPPRAFWILPGLVIWHFAGALLAYSTGRNDIQWWLGTSADRVISQIVPLAMLSAAWAGSLWMAAAENNATPAKPAVNTVGSGRKDSRPKRSRRAAAPRQG